VSTRVQRVVNVTHNWSLEGAPTDVLEIIGQYLGESSNDVLTYIKTLPQNQQADMLLQIINDPQSNSSIINHILHEAEYTLEDTQRSFLLFLSKTVGIRQVPLIRDLFPTEDAMEAFVTAFTLALSTLRYLECRNGELMGGAQLQRLCSACPQLNVVDLKNCYALKNTDLLHLRGLPLQYLRLWSCCQITNTGLSYLYDLPLTHIWIDGTCVTAFGIQQLQAHRPGIRIVDYNWWHRNEEHAERIAREVCSNIDVPF